MSRDNFDPSKTPGTFAAPPDYAPHEVADGSTVAPTQEQVDRAARNERQLQPLVFEASAPPAALNVAKQDIPAHLVKPVQLPARTDHQPAASNTDSPSRGMPRPIVDPGKQITGGFGAAGPAQYFPLDGSELKEAVRSLMDKLNARLDRDLRFHVAITYPRVTATVIVRVEGFTGDTNFEMQAPPFVHDRTPVDIAEAAGAQPVAFEEQEQLREMHPDGTAENPPDRVRDELGLDKPRKQVVETPGGRMWVDRRENLINSF